MRILVTGSEGLIGARLIERLSARGDEVIPFDIRRARADIPEDIGDPAALATIGAVDGAFHLAAVSRVAWGEARPDLCERTNEQGTANLIRALRAQAPEAWLVFASSREVYGDPEHLPIDEGSPLAPINAYGRSKATGERLVADGVLRHAIVRLSSVYGTVNDHHDRAIPALLTRALAGLPLRLTGSGNRFDFVHVDDSVAGLLAAADALATRAGSLPPVHLASGTGTSLGELAAMIVAITGSSSSVEALPPRPFDVGGFIGDPARAATLLDWRAQVALADGIAGLAEALRQGGDGFVPAVIPDPADLLR